MYNPLNSFIVNLVMRFPVLATVAAVCAGYAYLRGHV
jgi:hypothetical protein